MTRSHRSRWLGATVLAMVVATLPVAAQDIETLGELAPAVELPGLIEDSEDGQRGAGTEERDWVEGPAAEPASLSPQDYGLTVVPAVIPARDGRLLDARLFLPTRAPGEEPGPCVVATDGYAPPSAISSITIAATHPPLVDLATRGYAGAHVFLRGVDVPEGEGLYYRYAEDGHDVVEWMAEQPWCDGNVGMLGVSLLGISQWLAAAATPPSLKAIIPEVGCGDCYWHLWFKGGTLPGSGRANRTPPITTTDEYGAAMQHRDDDDWWRSRDTDTLDHRAIASAGTAVLQCGGWDDYIFSGGMRAVEDVTAAGGDGMHIVGPCSHGGSTPTLEPYDFQTFRVLWFDRFLRGIDNGIDRGPRALIYVEGAEQYRFESEWPIPDTRHERLYLRAEASGTSASRNDGSLSPRRPAPRSQPATYDHSPDGPHNDAGGGSARPTTDKREHEAHAVTWTTAPLTEPTEVTGWPLLDFWAASTAEDTDFVVELIDVAPDGSARQITRGWLNAPRSFDRSHPQPLEPGRAYRFQAELEPLSYVFQPGHRIRVMVSGSDMPGTAANPNPATVTIFQQPNRPSALVLPIIGSAALPEWAGPDGTDS